MASTDIQVKRVYEGRGDDDGTRVLVDRIWPRGLTKADADLDEWCKDISPSTELRKWFSHSPAKRDEFRDRYLAELKDPEHTTALASLRDLAHGHRLTLLTATKDLDLSHAPVLAEILAHRAR